MMMMTDANLVSSFKDRSLKMAFRGKAKTSDYINNIVQHETFGRTRLYSSDSYLNNTRELLNK